MLSSKSDKPVIIWLLTVCFLVFMMVLIGGITRLTDSGLSMVDWKPIMGSIPPMNLEQWTEAFDKYKQFPEYKFVNSQMTLSEFKYIFFWEYFHRLMGRVVGLVFFFPFIYFLIKGRLVGHRKKLLIAFVLGGSQGLLGWYMVKSGLVMRPDVSHFRLAAHLSLAFIIIGYIFWIIFSMINIQTIRKPKAKIKIISYSFLALLSFQIVYGAFVAGLDAGIGYNTFPLMNGELLASSAVSDMGFMHDALYNPAMIQFIHRLSGVLLFLFSIYVFFVGHKSEDRALNLSATRLGILTWVQVLLGISTLVMAIPISLASLHQVIACVLFILAIRFVYISLNKSMI